MVHTLRIKPFLSHFVLCLFQQRIIWPCEVNVNSEWHDGPLSKLSTICPQYNIFSVPSLLLCIEWSPTLSNPPFVAQQLTGWNKFSSSLSARAISEQIINPGNHPQIKSRPEIYFIIYNLSALTIFLC